jgi:dihydrofolate synthase/folylpolyglutamate synthase
MYSRIGSDAFKKDLTNIKLLCDHLGNPQKNFRSIHIGGTNGKGSTSHMLAAILQTAGYKTGLYTSPHLYDFRERIRINGDLVAESFVISFVENIKPVIERIQPSFFEITVAMAFVYFAQQQVDIAIIEVGLGGRLDSTNIIQPLISVITNIGWDHMNMLGNSLGQIAAEKAGIIKSHTPVIVGEQSAETFSVFLSVAEQVNAPIYFAEEAFNLEHFQLLERTIDITIKESATGQTQTYTIDLPGIYQTKNVITVLQTVAVLNILGFSINQVTVKDALQQVRKLTGLGGRWEILSQKPTVVLEVAHNEDGLHQMLSHIKALTYNQLHLIIGMVKDKEAEKVLSLLPTSAIYYFTHAHIPRALQAVELHTKAKEFSLIGTTYDDVNYALQQAIQHANAADLIIVCGSIFLVAEVNKELFTA